MNLLLVRNVNRYSLLSKEFDMKCSIVTKMTSPKNKIVFNKSRSYKIPNKKKIVLKRMIIGLGIFIILILILTGV
jgi:hypothetical protein